MRELLVEPGELVLREQNRILAREVFTDADASLREALQRLSANRAPAPIRVRVACSHARMFLLPWVRQLTTPERWHALAASRFEQGYGEAPDDWQLRVADDAPPRSRLAVALPAALLRAVRDVLKPRRMAVGLLEALGALLAREPAFHGCVAEIGQQSACLLMLHAGELRRVRTRRYETPDEIVAAARLEWAAAGAGEKVPEPTASSVALLGSSTSGPTLASALGSSRVLELA